MLPTTGLVIGAREDLPRSVKQFASDCAGKGSISPECFGCCHGEDQARGVIINFINRTFGWISLRGMAWVRHTALTAAVSSEQYAAGRSSSTGVRGAEDEKDSICDRAQGGFTSPARALGGAALGLQLT